MGNLAVGGLMRRPGHKHSRTTRSRTAAVSGLCAFALSGGSSTTAENGTPQTTLSGVSVFCLHIREAATPDLTSFA